MTNDKLMSLKYYIDLVNLYFEAHSKEFKNKNLVLKRGFFFFLKKVYSMTFEMELLYIYIYI